jgi:hypothetical protein
MPPAHCYAALQLLHGNIYESSLIYHVEINPGLQIARSAATPRAAASQTGCILGEWR